jgi:hypothetical protein
MARDCYARVGITFEQRPGSGKAYLPVMFEACSIWLDGMSAWHILGLGLYPYQCVLGHPSLKFIFIKVVWSDMCELQVSYRWTSCECYFGWDD